MDNIFLYRNIEWKSEKVNGRNLSLPIDWNIKKIEDIGTLLIGNNAPQLEKDFINGNINFFRVSDYKNKTGRFIEKSRDQINEVCTNSLKLSPKGSILLTKSGMSSLMNQRCILKEDSYVVNHFSILNVNNLNINEFIYYKTLYLDFNMFASGSALPAINNSAINLLKISIPEIEEQTRIADILTKQEDLIEHTKIKIEKLKKQRKYFQQELLSGRLRMRLTQSAMGKAIKLGLLEQNLLNAEGEKMEYGTDKVEGFSIEIIQGKQEEFENWLNIDFDSKIEFFKNTQWKDVKVNGREIEIPFDWDIFKVGDMFDISRGTVISKDYIRDHIGIFPVYSSATENNGCIGYIDTFSKDGEYLTWTTDGIYAGTLFYRNEKFSPTNICGILKKKDNLNYNLKVLKIFLQKSFFNNVEKIGNSKLMSNVVQKIKAVLPVSFLEQTLIATLLTKTDTIIEKEEENLKLEEKRFKFFQQELLSGRIRTK